MNRAVSIRGFSLLELTIILVIIGLVLGAVLTGRELIRVANLRSTVAQFHQYQTAAKAFISKYNHPPGDLPSATAQAYGLTGGACVDPSTPGGCAGDGDRSFDAREMIGIFYHISKAGMVKETLTDYAVTNPVNVYGGTCYGDPDEADLTYPLTKFDDGTNWYTMNMNSDGSSIIPVNEAYLDDVGLGLGVNLSHCIEGWSAVPNQGWYQLTPVDAEWIDSKLDDGQPDTGVVNIWFDSISLSDVTVFCNNGSSYNLAVSDTPACQITIKFF